MKKSICITGLMLRNTEEHIIVELEIDGKWIEIINDFVGRMAVPVSHIIEPGGIEKARAEGYEEGERDG